MKSDDIPAWVPETVRTVALGQGVWNDKLQRVLIHPSMQRVWDRLRKQKVYPCGIKVIDFAGLLDCFDICDKYFTPLPDQACAVLFLALTTISMRLIQDIEGRETAITVESLRGISEPFHRILEGLKLLQTSDPCWPLPVPDDVQRAMQILKLHCDDRIDFISQKDSSYLVTRSTADIIIRGHVRAIGTAMYTLYGRCLYGTVATIANVMFEPKVKVTEGKVTKWCTQPPLPISSVA